MSVTQTLATSTTPAAVTTTGRITSPITLMRLLPDRIARVSFRIEGADGPFNVHANGVRAELIRAAIHKGDVVTVHAPCATLAHPAQTVPDLEADSVELHLR